MPKSCLEIAKDLGLPKQVVYRYIKANNIKEVSIEATTKLYSEADEEAIKKGIKEQSARKPRSDSERLHQTLLNTIEAQQNTIEKLTKLLDQEQQLRMVAEQKLIAIEEKKETEQQPTKKSWWPFR